MAPSGIYISMRCENKLLQEMVFWGLFGPKRLPFQWFRFLYTGKPPPMAVYNGGFDHFYLNDIPILAIGPYPINEMKGCQKNIKTVIFI